MNELSNHLGNVLAVVTDHSIPVYDGNDEVDTYYADVVSAQDYSPGGMPQPGRSFGLGDYRYGFNGMESDDEVKGTKNSYTTEFRQYDPRIGRWLSIDPMAKVLPSESPYNFANNIPTFGNDPGGDICVPCIALLLGGALTGPSLAVAPTGNYAKDAQGIANAKEIQAKWVVYTLFASGLGSGMITAESFLTEVSAQYGTQVIFNSFKEYDSNGKINLERVLFESAKNIDVFDAAFGKFSGVGVLDNIVTAIVDITPDEAQVLGLNKDAASTTIDFILNTVAGDSKAPKGKYSSLIDKATAKAQEVAGEELKNAYQKNHSSQAQREASNFGVQDNTNVQVNKPAYIKESEDD